jgi:hypothetical protein
MNSNCNPKPTNTPIVIRTKRGCTCLIRDHGSKNKLFRGRGFPKTPRLGNRLDYQRQPKA